ncbi:hypothetical protein BGZ47_003718 [Haplosporangium gracile]|nr:hypothetical protein BGZ47_003718 [Haplosporangium gracile]
MPTGPKDLQKCLQELYLLAVQQSIDEYVEFLDGDSTAEMPPQANALDFVVYSEAPFSQRALVSKVWVDVATESGPLFSIDHQSKQERDRDFTSEELARILFPDLGSQPFRLHGRDAPAYSPRELTHDDEHDLYDHALSILTNWGSASLPAQKDCLIALSNIINTLNLENRTLYRNFGLYSGLRVVKDLFLVSETQRNLFAGIVQVLGQGRDKDVIRLHRYVGRRKYELQEQCEQGGWPLAEKEAKTVAEEYYSVKVLEKM